MHMASCSRPLTLLQLPRCAHSHTLHLSRPRHCYSLFNRRYASQLTTTESPPSFQDLGVSENVAKALQKRFPNVRIPTKSQIRFIPPIISGGDVLLQNDTGTGKTFGLILALLSIPREKKTFYRAKGIKRQISPSTILLITPHRELALQCMHWIESLHSATGKGTLANRAFLVARGIGSTLEEQIEQLRLYKPHLVIGTPNALLDVFKEAPDALPPWSVSTIVVDEVDSLIERPPHNPREYEIKKFQRMLKRHPSPTRQILDLIYNRKPLKGTEPPKDPEANERPSVDGPPENRPQFIATSATLRSNMKFSLVRASGWITRRWKDLYDIHGTSRADVRSIQDEVATTEDGQSVQHSALIVNKDGGVTNIEGARVATAPELGDDGPDEIPIVHGEVEDLPWGPEESIEDESEEFDSSKSPFNQYALEAIATVFALEVPRLALLVLPATSPVKWAIHDLRRLGVNAHGLNVLDEENVRSHLLQMESKPVDNPTLLVATTDFTRGLDLPELSHVFRLGIFDDRSPRTYVHIAGRVGRFGRPGKVITIVDAPYTFHDGKQKRHLRDEPTYLAQIYKKLRISPVKLDYFG